MAVYSIKDLEMISGIKAHTLRIWEQRYHIIHPKRTPTNIRFYEDDDLKHLLNISLLNKNGLKISKIASMSEEEIAEAVSDLSKGSFEDSVQIDALTISMMELDEAKFETIIAANLQNLGFERTMMEVIYPFLDKLSLLWITGSIHPVQENFISNLVRQKLIAAIDALSANKSCHAGFTLYLPEGESQELSLLFLQYLIKKRGFRTLYLGQNTSLPDLAEACSIFPTDYVLTIISEGFTKQSVHQYLKDLQKVCEGKIIYVTGYQVLIQGIQTSENVVVLENLDSFTTLIDTLPCN